MDQDAILNTKDASTQATLCWMGTQLPKKWGTAAAPHFWAHVYGGQTAVWIKIPRVTEVRPVGGLPQVAPPSSHRNDSPPQFSPMHVCCGQKTVWIKMPLGTEVGLGPGDIVLDGDTACPQKRRSPPPPPQFSADVCCGPTDGWIKMPLAT